MDDRNEIEKISQIKVIRNVRRKNRTSFVVQNPKILNKTLEYHSIQDTSFSKSVELSSKSMLFNLLRSTNASVKMPSRSKAFWDKNDYCEENIIENEKNNCMVIVKDVEDLDHAVIRSTLEDYQLADTPYEHHRIIE